MIDFDIKVQGLAELDRQLQGFATKVQKRAIDKALTAAGRVVVRAAKANAPSRTGALKRNIGVKRSRRDKLEGHSNRVIVGVQHGRARKSAASFKTKRGATRTRRLTTYDKRGQDPFYFRFQETGYKAVGRARRGSPAHSRARVIPGKRFLLNAFTSTANKQLEVFRETLAKEIGKLT